MRCIYDCVIENGCADCLELGTGYGTTTCIIAAALQETGRGKVTTVDRMDRDPIGVSVLASHCGLSEHINVVVNRAGYNWYLSEVISAQTRDGRCEPCIDFCFLDGAHEWDPDALAVFLVAKLLRPGAWLALDDLNFRIRGCHPGWEEAFADRSERQLDACQVKLVFDLVLRQHPDFAEFTVADGGRTGWARKIGATLPAWRPPGLVLEPGRLNWCESFAAENVVREALRTPGLLVADQGPVLAISATESDPSFTLPRAIAGDRAVNVISLRLRLLKPMTETLQVFWVDDRAAHFSEERSVRVGLFASDGWRDVVLRLTGSGAPQPIRSLRLDLTDGPSSVLWESFSVGAE